LHAPCCRIGSSPSPCGPYVGEQYLGSHVSVLGWEGQRRRNRGATEALVPRMQKPCGQKYLFAPALICQLYYTQLVLHSSNAGELDETNMHHNSWRSGLRPEPRTLGELTQRSAPPDSLAGGQGAYRNTASTLTLTLTLTPPLLSPSDFELALPRNADFVPTQLGRCKTSILDDIVYIIGECCNDLTPSTRCYDTCNLATNFIRCHRGGTGLAEAVALPLAPFPWSPRRITDGWNYCTLQSCRRTPCYAPSTLTENSAVCRAPEGDVVCRAHQGSTKLIVTLKRSDKIGQLGSPLCVIKAAYSVIHGPQGGSAASHGR